MAGARANTTLPIIDWVVTESFTCGEELQSVYCSKCSPHILFLLCQHFWPGGWSSPAGVWQRGKGAATALHTEIDLPAPQGIHIAGLKGFLNGGGHQVERAGVHTAKLQRIAGSPPAPAVLLNQRPRWRCFFNTG